MSLQNLSIIYNAAVPGPKLSYYKYQMQILPALLFGSVEDAVPVFGLRQMFD